MHAHAPSKDRVLVVEDEADLSGSLAFALRAKGYDVLVADRGARAIEALGSFQPDLVLLDLMLPDMSGIEICRHLRKSSDRRQPSVIILSARTDEVDRVVGFEVGADDYVSKPFSLRELTLRIEARLRTRKAVVAAGKAPGEDGRAVGSVLRLRNLAVDESAHRVFVDGKEIRLSALEMRLLLYFLQVPGKMRTRKELLTDVWGYHPEVTSRTVDSHIKRLRDKLGGASDLLQTVRGVGFRMAEPGATNGSPRSGPSAL
jgi:two-component system, OmpR family, phosphate regulon response regulator PhoB